MNNWKVGDKVEWEHRVYKRRSVTITLRRGTITAVGETTAVIDKGKWQRRELVHFSRLRPLQQAVAQPVANGDQGGDQR